MLGAWTSVAFCSNPILNAKRKGRSGDHTAIGLNDEHALVTAAMPRVTEEDRFLGAPRLDPLRRRSSIRRRSPSPRQAPTDYFNRRTPTVSGSSMQSNSMNVCPLFLKMRTLGPIFILVFIFILFLLPNLSVGKFENCAIVVSSKLSFDLRVYIAHGLLLH